ncbi:MAG: hypothetical protein H7Y38_02515, partial [Armatimonadetes bacterium]|nr:hypothetical protein [Armatimonadota bacterium]
QNIAAPAERIVADPNEAISAAQVVQPMRDALLKLLRKDPALSFTLAYLFLTAIGIAYDWWFFLYFGVNVLEYADFSDFLLAAVREPVVILLTVVSAFVILVLHEINYRARIRFAAYDRLCRSPWGRTGVATMYMSPRATAIATIIVYFGGVFTPLYAQYRADRIKSGETRPVTIRLSDAGANQPATRTLPLVGTTSRFVFVYDAKTKRTHILPVENIAEITVTRPPRPDRD